jgi:hypothetical protein
MVAEEREAPRLNPNHCDAHYAVGYAFEKKALEEYRTACELAPRNPDYRKAYEGLVKRTTH